MLTNERVEEGVMAEMKKNRRIVVYCLFATLLIVSILSGCANKPHTDGSSSMNGNQYVWEKKGFGGDFIITLNDDRTYQYYAGFLSSYIGMGTWINDNGIIVMSEDKEFCGNDNVFRFKLTEEGLIYIADGSSKFMYVDVADGDRFLLRSGIYSLIG